jgi:hypothetical protein
VQDGDPGFLTRPGNAQAALATAEFSVPMLAAVPTADTGPARAWQRLAPQWGPAAVREGELGQGSLAVLVKVAYEAGQRSHFGMMPVEGRPYLIEHYTSTEKL